MTEGQRVTAHATVSSGGATNFTVSDFSTTDGTSLGTSDALIVSDYLHENDVDVNRTGDPDSDSTFEINETIESRTGAGERTDVTHIVTDVAGIEVSETSSNQQEITLLGVRVDASKVFVEQGASVGTSSEVVRTTGSRGQEETVYELVAGGATDIIRRHDSDDDGTFEISATIDSFSGAGIKRELILPMTDELGRSNAEMETALAPTGSANDVMILGSIGVSL